MAQIILCDLDGTAAEYKTGEILPGVLETLARVRAQGIRILWITNQAGPGWRHYLEQRNQSQEDRYPTLLGLGTHLLNVSSQLQAQQESWYISLYDARFLTLNGGDEGELALTLSAQGRDLTRFLEPVIGHIKVFTTPFYRKPSPGMYWQAALDAGVTSRDEIIVVGDQESDEIPAVSSRLTFLHADNFFGRRDWAATRS